MHKALLTIKEDTLVSRIYSLPVWGDNSGFEIVKINELLQNDMESYNEYEVILADKENGLWLLRHSLEMGKRLRVILFDSCMDYETARQGIILNAYDYFVEPFDTALILASLKRIADEISNKGISDEHITEQMMHFFDDRDKAFYEYLNKIVYDFKMDSANIAAAAKRLGEVYDQVFEDIMSKYQWCDLYINDRMYRLAESDVPVEMLEIYSQKLKILFTIFCELYPSPNEQLAEVIDTILNYPESDLRQKTLSAELHINSTYLSTVFVAQTGVRFIDYVNDVKLKRAAWLLLKSQLGITDITKRLNYKDKSYFSKLFRSRYGITPSEFRMPPAYDFQI